MIDSGLCHGAAGVGHLFNRLYQASGDPALAEAARFWFDRALAQYQPGEGIGGVTITAKRLSDGATFTTKSWGSGGYTLKLGKGTYSVTASGGTLGKTITYGSVMVGD